MGIIRKTKSIKILLDAFEKDSNALSVTSLIERFSSQMNKTTIYRVLDKLEDDGFLHSFLGNNGYKWYAKCNGCCKSGHHDSHAHFQCINCGKVDCLTTSFVIPKIPNRRVDVTNVLLQGSCEDCIALNA